MVRDELERHNCHLPSTERSRFRHSTRGDPWRKKLRFSLTRHSMVWEGHRLTRSHFRSSHAVAAESRRHLSSPHWFMVHPMSRLQHHRQWTMLALWLLVVFKDPAEAAHFLPETDGSGCLDWFNRGLDALLLLHCCTEFLFGYVDFRSQEIVLSPGMCATRYLRGFFFVDFIGAAS